MSILKLKIVLISLFFLLISISLYLQLQKYYYVNIEDFGATPNDNKDDTTAIIYAIEYAKENHLKTVYIPPKEYLIKAHTYSEFEGGISIPSGITLRGKKNKSTLKLNPKSINKKGIYAGISLQSNTKLKNLIIDGQKNLINMENKEYIGFRAIRLKDPYTKNVSIKALETKNLAGKNKESFGIFLNDASSNINVKDIKAFNIDGTGIHINGNYLNGMLSTNISVKNILVYNNSWSGISTYGAKNVKISNVIAFNNKKHGLNFEWCYNTVAKRIISFHNGAGIGSFGKTSFDLSYAVLYHNNRKFSQSELNLRAGSWWAGTPPPRGVARNINISKSIIIPSLKSKLLTAESDNKVTTGLQSPYNITISKTYSTNWQYIIITSHKEIKYNWSIPNIRVNPLLQPHLLYKGNASSFKSWNTLTQSNKNGSTSIISYKLYGNVSSMPILPANKRLLIMINYKASPNSRWVLGIKTIAPASSITQGILLLPESRSKQWSKAELIIEPSNEKRLIQLQSNYESQTKIKIKEIKILEF